MSGAYEPLFAWLKAMDACEPAVKWLRQKLVVEAYTYEQVHRELLAMRMTPEEKEAALKPPPERHVGRAWLARLCRRIGIRTSTGSFSGAPKVHDGVPVEKVPFEDFRVGLYVAREDWEVHQIMAEAMKEARKVTQKKERELSPAKKRMIDNLRALANGLEQEDEHHPHSTKLVVLYTAGLLRSGEDIFDTSWFGNTDETRAARNSILMALETAKFRLILENAENDGRLRDALRELIRDAPSDD